jgi:hypothetical protein
MESVTAATVMTVSCLVYTLATVVETPFALRVATATATSTTVTIRTTCVKTSSALLCFPGLRYSEYVLSWQVS